jgi:hypothetical protein
LNKNYFAHQREKNDVKVSRGEYTDWRIILSAEIGKTSFNQEVTLNGYCAFLDFWVAWLLLQPGFFLPIPIAIGISGSKVTFKEELKKMVL